MAEQMNVVVKENFERAEDFISLYANNIQFEQSAFDLKLIFGELDQSQGKVRVEQHSSVTIPWAQAKLLMFYLQVNISLFELENGKIKIRNDLLPQPVRKLSEEEKKIPKAEELTELLEALRQQFISNL